MSASGDLTACLSGKKFGTILADPPWRFANRTGKVAPEHRRLERYGTLSFEEIAALPVSDLANEPSHCYLWVPNALLPWGLDVLDSWGFKYKTNLIWHKVRKDGGSDGRGVGFYFRNVTEVILFGVRGKNARTLDPGRGQVNLIASRKREHSRKPDEQYGLIERCSRGPYLEFFGRGTRDKWTVWGTKRGRITGLIGQPILTTRPDRPFHHEWWRGCRQPGTCQEIISTGRMAKVRYIQLSR